MGADNQYSYRTEPGTRWVGGLLLAVCALVGLADAALRSWPAAPAFTGAGLRGYERALEIGSPCGKALRPPVQTLLSQSLGRGNSQTVVGAGGWLYYTTGLRHVVGPDVPLDTRPGGPLAAFASLRAALAERDIHLLVLSVPDKATLCPEPLTGRAADVPQRNPAVPRLWSMAADLGVEALDPTDLLWAERAGGVYLRTDTHWNPRGMALTAQAVADRLNHLGWLEAAPRTAYHAAPEVRVPWHGDLIRMLGLRDGAAWPAPESVTLTPVQDDQGRPWRPGVAPPLVVAGDSYSDAFAAQQAGFVPHLALRLGVQARWVDRAERLLTDDGALRGARVVLWQIAERRLTENQRWWPYFPAHR
ncbi:MAG: hypothetical protein HZB16_04665 [Armatimonadetes bacterium]|nr:hypothetical protein [Armatimonadota bacterium]